MKWLPIKKFRPACAVTDVFLRTDGGGIYTGYNEEYDGDKFTWRENHGEEEEIKDVTHFCIPDPIEIEL